MNLVVKIISCSIFIVTIVLGSLGNILVFYIYNASPSLRKNSFAIYFKVIAIIDELLLIDSLFDLMSYGFNFKLQNQSAFLCPALAYFNYILYPISGNLLALVAFDRFVHIKFPNKYNFVYKYKFQIPAIAFVIAYNLIFYMGFFWDKRLESSSSLDNVTTNLSQINAWTCQDLDGVEIIYQLDLYNSTIVPFVLMSIFSLLTVYLVVRSRTRVNVSSTTSSTGVRSLSRKDKKFAFLSIFLNVLYLFFNLPCVLFINYGINLDEDIYNSVYFPLNAINYMNFGINFFIQFFFNSIFRNHLLRVFKISTANLAEDTKFANSVTF
jgi:hypothetical protein